MERTKKRRLLNLSYPLTDRDGIYSNYANTGDTSKLLRRLYIKKTNMTDSQKACHCAQ